WLSECFRSDFHTHQTSLRLYVEQLPSIAPPHKMRAACIGDHPLPLAGWKALDVNIFTAGFIRNVRQPASVRRKARVFESERPLQDDDGLAVTLRREHPQLLFSVALAQSVNQKTPVHRPIIQRRGLRQV